MRETGCRSMVGVRDRGEKVNVRETLSSLLNEPRWLFPSILALIHVVAISTYYDLPMFRIDKKIHMRCKYVLI